MNKQVSKLEEQGLDTNRGFERVQPHELCQVEGGVATKFWDWDGPTPVPEIPNYPRRFPIIA